MRTSVYYNYSHKIPHNQRFCAVSTLQFFCSYFPLLCCHPLTDFDEHLSNDSVWRFIYSTLINDNIKNILFLNNASSRLQFNICRRHPDLTDRSKSFVYAVGIQFQFTYISLFTLRACSKQICNESSCFYDPFIYTANVQSKFQSATRLLRVYKKTRRCCRWLPVAVSGPFMPSLTILVSQRFLSDILSSSR